MADAEGADPIRAAGAVVWRHGPNGPQIVLVHRPRYDDWSYPKGKCERGEHVLQTALREVAEEAGLRVVLGRRLASSVYEVTGRVKQVSYWAARSIESIGFEPGHEVDNLAWLEVSDVAERLSHERDLVLLDEFRSGPTDSVPFILLRHTAAGIKSAPGAADLDRPLDADGSAAASQLAELLASYGRCAVVSSAARRCVDTVTPYAEAVEVPVEVEPSFTVLDQVRPDSDTGLISARRIAELAEAGLPTLVCAHGENLPALAATARRALGADAAADAGPPLNKGAFIVLQSAAGVLVSAERHDLTDDISG